MLLSCILFKNFGSNGSGRRSDRKRRRHLRRYMEECGPAAGEEPAESAQV